MIKCSRVYDGGTEHEHWRQEWRNLPWNTSAAIQQKHTSSHGEREQILTSDQNVRLDREEIALGGFFSLWGASCTQPRVFMWWNSTCAYVYICQCMLICVCVFGCVFAESPAQASSMEALNNDRLTVVITLFQLKDVNRPWISLGILFQLLSLPKSPVN